MELIKIDRNGSKHYAGWVTCDRCGGAGGAKVWQYTGWTCYKCGGTGKVWSKWIERTPEYQAKLDARREAKNEAKKAEIEAKRAEYERKQAEIKAEAEKREAEEKARKAISKYVGTVGDKYNAEVVYTGSAHFDVKSFAGYGTETMYVHNFTDADGNKIVWKTTADIGVWDANGHWQGYEDGDKVMLKGTIKEHKEYKDEKQTVLKRCKVERSR